MSKTMVVTFVSNYINHHQLPFCEAMLGMKDKVEFHFIQTEPMEQKRIEMGWGLDVKDYPFVLLLYENRQECQRLILESDVTIFGWTDGAVADLEKKRMLATDGRLSFRVSERIYREGQWKAISPKGLINKYHEHYIYRNKNVFLLCAGAYVASDFALIRSYPGAMLKWGYFPKVAVSLDEIGAKMETKPSAKLRLLWAGRLISLKHPEFAIRAAKVLRDKGHDFDLEIVGDGNQRNNLAQMILDYQLTDCVHLRGAKKPSEVIEYMKKADVFIFTSNYLEGWGAVVNEAMACGCAVVASKEAGAVPFLIKDGSNGLSYDKGSFRAFMSKLQFLLKNRDEVRRLGANAAATIADTWNAENAARRLVQFSKEFLAGGERKISHEGPMSSASVIKPPGFLRSLQEKNRLE